MWSLAIVNPAAVGVAFQLWLDLLCRAVPASRWLEWSRDGSFSDPARPRVRVDSTPPVPTGGGEQMASYLYVTAVE